MNNLSRRTLLTLTVTLTSGCVQQSTDISGENTTISNEFNCEDSFQPEPDVEAGIEHEIDLDDDEVTVTSVGFAEYPDHPSEISEEIILEFIREYEPSYQKNYHLGSSEEHGDFLMSISTNVEEATHLGKYSGVDFIKTSSFVTFDRYVEQYSDVESAHYPVTALYGIDKAGLIRSKIGHEDSDNSPQIDFPEDFTNDDLLYCL